MDKSERVPTALQGKYAEIVAFTDGFCQQHLNEEYLSEGAGRLPRAVSLNKKSGGMSDRMPPPGGFLPIRILETT